MFNSNIVIVFLFPAIAFAGIAEQTDWSGGPGIPGPVDDWESYFDGCINIDWESNPGTIILDQLPNRTYVNSDVSAKYLDVADIDQDGDYDIVSGYSSLSWWENIDGTGSLWTEHTIQEEYFYSGYIHILDMDLDVDSDILTSYPGSDVIFWFENTGDPDNWQSHLINSAFDLSPNVWPADIDRDGDQDVVCAVLDSEQNQYHWYENQNGSWQQYPINNLAATTFYSNTGDIDGDEDPDVIGSGSPGGSGLVWYENTGSFETEWPEHSINSSAFSHLAIVDIDSDGDNDIIGVKGVSSTVNLYWIENYDGAGIEWHAHRIIKTYDHFYNIVASNINSDTWPDIIAATGIELYWLKNINGQGTEWETNTISLDVEQPFGISSCDINGDEEVDVVSADISKNNISWWNLNVFSSYGYLTSSIRDCFPHVEWKIMDWTSELPPATSLYFQVRSSDDPYSMGLWSPPFYSHPFDIGQYLPLYTPYFQYRVTLETSDPDTTPMLDWVYVDWREMGCEEGFISASGIAGPSANPCTPHSLIEYTIAEAGHVKIMIFDLTGRLVTIPVNEWLDCGLHAFALDGFASGVFFIQFEAGPIKDSYQFVVVSE